MSLDLITRFAPDRGTRIIDVGGGTSTLVDHLLRDGYSRVTVLDIASSAIAVARERIGPRATDVVWIEADVLRTELPQAAFDLWHDRAVFHFLTEAEDRAAYIAQLRRALCPGGLALIATFAEDGPARCSGLPVVRYSPAALHEQFGSSFHPIETVREAHQTPSGAIQSFIYTLLQLHEHATSDH
jgi:ubiquinone/menaquinone biosynthesis C-methylase UbiE